MGDLADTALDRAAAWEASAAGLGFCEALDAMTACDVLAEIGWCEASVSDSREVPGASVADGSATILATVSLACEALDALAACEVLSEIGWCEASISDSRGAPVVSAANGSATCVRNSQKQRF